MLAIAGGIILAVIILANLEAIFAIGLWVIVIAIIATIAITLFVFSFDSIENLLFVILLIFSIYLFNKYSIKSEIRDAYLKENKIPEMLINLVKNNIGVDDLTIRLSKQDYQKLIKLYEFVVEFKQLTKAEKIGFLITVKNKDNFICAIHTKNFSFDKGTITSNSVVYGAIYNNNTINLTVASFCNMQRFEKLVTALNNSNIFIS